MITHALARNTVVPFFMALFIIHRYYPDRTEKIYKVFTLLTYILLPSYLIFTFLGINPVTWVLSPTWTANQSTLQYIIYITATNYVLLRKTKNHGLNWTLAFISATSAGYLYEIPYWIRIGGIFNVIRTAKTSFMLFDFGLLATIYLIFMLRLYRTKIDRRLLFAFTGYLAYMIIYWICYPEKFIELYQVTGIPTAILLRTPAMILTHIASTNINYLETPIT